MYFAAEFFDFFAFESSTLDALFYNIYFMLEKKHFVDMIINGGDISKIGMASLN